ncbi:MAG: fructose-bisphosphate aldolase class I [SAR202 cluster bacterium]|nr:fructose-bisphosphate aldolase class I [SAR202 cluster bacterium]|tara:strand:+ start:43919 stop:44926 length:1008 start_codon:yes stop_codon:yes gene_type:complete
MDLTNLSQTAAALVAPKKGILAADESSNTIKKRFDSINVESTEVNRKSYREMLFKTPGISDFISGVILFDETIRQKNETGESLVSILKNQGIQAGIKVDTGAKPLSGTKNETITEGLDGLRERLLEYHELGASFTKWRAVINISNEEPSDYAIKTNAHALARFASLSQEANLVPIVEPEVLMDGSHSIEKCYEVSHTVLNEVYYELHKQKINLNGTLLKPNMIIPGKDSNEPHNPEKVAEYTVKCLMDCVPASVPGIVFLSGGQTDNDATINLHHINVIAKKIHTPWELSFSYGRGLQSAPLEAWSGNEKNITLAQNAFHSRAKDTSAARNGSYK